MEMYFAANNIDATVIITPTHHGEKKEYRFDGKKVSHVKILNFDSKLDIQNLENNENLTELLIDGDPEFDIENTGKIIQHVNKLVVNNELKPVYNYQEIDVLMQPNGEIKTRPHKQSKRNILEKLPVITSDEYISPRNFIRKYLVKQSFFMGHTDGVSYKFLFELAKNLSDMQKLVRIYAIDSETKKKIPIVIKNGGTLYPAAFIYGKIHGEKYCLRLLLVDRELNPDNRNSAGNSEE
ncbi:MAG: hypothetical protein ACTSWX_02875 [Promethearchaeota archaeon]